MKTRIAIIGAGLCGSTLGALLRNHYHVTIIEQGKKKRPLFDDVVSSQGDINTSINRAEGLGGTTNYWHNALIELDASDLQKAGINALTFDKYYNKAWSHFITDEQKREFDMARDTNCRNVGSHSSAIAHMVVPYSRSNAWTLANARCPGDAIEIVYGIADRIVPAEIGRGGYVIVNTSAGSIRVESDYFVVCAGGLASPVLLSRSIGEEDGFCYGYHDHPMAYVAKVQLRPNSILKTLSCTSTESADVRSGFLYDTSGIKTVFYLRPAMDLSLKSITGATRYILSDLRNDPFSAKKIFQLLTNLDAVKEAVLFKTKKGFRGDYFSILMLGEQTSLTSRGITLKGADRPTLNWHITSDEQLAYRTNFERFMAEYAADIIGNNTISPDQWEFRTAAHHSGCSRRFLNSSENSSSDFFAVNELANCYLCDASLLRAAGIANSGLTLVALCNQLAEQMIAAL